MGYEEYRKQDAARRVLYKKERPADVAKSIGCSESSVRRWAKKHGESGKGRA